MKERAMLDVPKDLMAVSDRIEAAEPPMEEGLETVLRAP
jgi:hypothetical protein